MLNAIPTEIELKSLLSPEVFSAWESLTKFIQQNYTMDVLWDIGRKAGVYECKVRKSGKTLCAFYAREHSFGVMIIFGAAERKKFEEGRENFSNEVQKIYDDTHQYHDGKWMMIDVTDETYFPEIKQLIMIKKKPRKQ